MMKTDTGTESKPARSDVTASVLQRVALAGACRTTAAIGRAVRLPGIGASDHESYAGGPDSAGLSGGCQAACGPGPSGYSVSVWVHESRTMALSLRNIYRGIMVCSVQFAPCGLR
jgi:hypothetical protein